MVEIGRYSVDSREMCLSDCDIKRYPILCLNVFPAESPFPRVLNVVDLELRAAVSRQGLFMLNGS